ncbi:MAG: indole-3-glycerol-phosphate synthase [Planctomycetes bacterium]|nr:indole-3-glycerol-phosphate synthase [Planctomycetota bacterium]MCB9935862.1 indole-3-glycerol-phosphate synthase [Planctomycetota bacterium]
MAKTSAERVGAARRRTSDAAIREAAEHAAPARRLRLGEDFGVIAEIKRRAPSSGKLAEGVNVAARAQAYERAGAVAVSVLTEPASFGGDLRDLREAATAGPPVMRKDFLVDAYQLYEARAHGADGVLLIAAILDDNQLRDLLGVADYLGLFALVEAFDEVDVERAQCAGAELVGVNCRNLRDLSVEFARFERLRPLIDRDRKAIAESGITAPEQLTAVRELGYHAALVGSALMRQADPAAALRQLLGTVPGEAEGLSPFSSAEGQAGRRGQSLRAGAGDSPQKAAR